MSFAAAASAKRKEAAGLAFVTHAKAFGNEVCCLLGVCKALKRAFVDVSEQPFVRAVKVAGINVSVSFDNELMSAMTAKSALFAFLTEIKSDKIVKKTNRNIVSSDEILDI